MKERIKRFIATTLAYFGIKPQQETPPTKAVASTAPRDTAPARAASTLPTPSKLWNPPAAETREALALTVRAVAAGIRSQMSSPLVNNGSQSELHTQLERISSSLLKIPARRFFPDTPNATELDAADRVHRANLRALPPVPAVGDSRTEVANALFGFASSLKTQVLASPVLAAPDMRKLKEQLSETADLLSGISGDVCVTRSSKQVRGR
jgi:hypothetical protein